MIRRLGRYRGPCVVSETFIHKLLINSLTFSFIYPLLMNLVGDPVFVLTLYVRLVILLCTFRKDV